MAEAKDDTASMDDGSDDAPTGPAAGPGATSNADNLWTSRRGKARCDSCRLRNLKCDRILPVCNQCRWTPPGSSCTYTPLPTPGARRLSTFALSGGFYLPVAHRGVPRCDRCRESNLKCDRAAPVCQYCRESNITDCRYTPKKRARPPLDQQPATLAPRVPYNTQAQSASFMFTNISGPTDSYTRSFINESSSSKDRMDVDRPLPPFPAKPAYEHGPPLALLPAPSGPSAYPGSQPFISHSFPEPVRSHSFKAWSHNAFAPLPDTVLRRLTGLSHREMPDRDAFDGALRSFRDQLADELRETVYLSAEDYATLANCLAKGNITRLSTRIRQWTLCHRLGSGSDRYNLIVAPRDSVFQLPVEKEQQLLKDFRASLDNGPAKGTDNQDTEPAFERVPVVNQIYDCLVYAHRGHASSVAVMMEIRRLGFATITWPMAEIFVNLCPLCSKGKAATGLGTKMGVSTGTGAR
ncbi:hypothetical protein C8F01DRAFT_1374311 [Mycena amicta]|nr:hypothetical protein C8F01DRAFT_1374311 [Mycena amicta]